MSTAVIDQDPAYIQYRSRVSLNEKAFAKKAESWTKKARKAFESRYGYDPQAQVRKDDFSLTEARKQLIEKYKLSEGVTETQMFALTSYLVMDDMTTAYQLVSVIYKSLAKLVQSKTLEGNYFAVQRGDVPVPVGEYEAFPESAVAGVLTRIRNYKYGRIFSYSNELADDDQTGSIRDQALNEGEMMAYAEEQAWIISLFQAYQPANIRSVGPNGGIIPPMNVATAGGYNVDSTLTITASAPTQVAIENLYTAADYVTDLEGNFALVNPNVGLFSASDKIAVKKIMQSMYTPSVPSATPGAVGGIFAENVLKGAFEPWFTPFAKRARVGIAGGNTRPWGIGEQGKIGAFQERTPLEVKQESPDAGDSFNQDSTRIRAKRRFGAGVVLPEFFLAGN